MITSITKENVTKTVTVEESFINVKFTPRELLILVAAFGSFTDGAFKKAANDGFASLVYSFPTLIKDAGKPSGQDLTNIYNPLYNVLMEIEKP